VSRERGGTAVRDRDRQSWLRGAPPPTWIRALPVVLLLGVCAATLTYGHRLDIGFLLGAIPPLAVLSYGPVGTAVLGGLVVAVLNVRLFHLDDPGSTDLLTVSFVAALSIAVSFVRSRRDAQLVTERAVAVAAQRAVLPPLPDRVGAVRCAGLYRAAQRDTLVGGDFFEVRQGPHGVRVAMGDVRGHGLAAVATVAALLGAFREAVLDQPDPESVAERLDRRLVVDSADVRHSELFATAVLLDFSPDADTVRIVSCGHPAPILLRLGTAVALEVPPCVPLGLGLSGVRPPTGLTVRLRPGDRLFLASDGVGEARDGNGVFYPLTERLVSLAGDDRAADDGGPDGLAERVWADLVRYSPTLDDDVTMLVLRPVPPRRP
jgi:serine phosphatase RsbU (regulator of sigma subunit)